MNINALKKELAEVKTKSTANFPDIDFELALYKSWLEKRADAAYWKSVAMILMWSLVLLLIVFWR